MTLRGCAVAHLENSRGVTVPVHHAIAISRQSIRDEFATRMSGETVHCVVFEIDQIDKFAQNRPRSIGAILGFKRIHRYGLAHSPLVLRSPRTWRAPELLDF